MSGVPWCRRVFGMLQLAVGDVFALVLIAESECCTNAIAQFDSKKG
ncbi:hypothetical protein C8C99_0490 [Acidovorax sp. 107]|nr:hypothetical protein C8C99_0490 [Acidovorax sp. 107]